MDPPNSPTLTTSPAIEGSNQAQEDNEPISIVDVVTRLIQLSGEGDPTTCLDIDDRYVEWISEPVMDGDSCFLVVMRYKRSLTIGVAESVLAAGSALYLWHFRLHYEAIEGEKAWDPVMFESKTTTSRESFFMPYTERQSFGSMVLESGAHEYLELWDHRAAVGLMAEVDNWTDMFTRNIRESIVERLLDPTTHEELQQVLRICSALMWLDRIQLAARRETGHFEASTDPDINRRG